MTGIIILAAGASTRLGQPKQKLAYEGNSLLQRAVQAALHSSCHSIAVVLGAGFEAILPDIKDLPVHIVYNNAWQQGMSSSIQAGLKYLQTVENDLDEVLLMLCDQPFANAALIHKLIAAKKETGKPIIACSYNDTVGVPALFDKTFFSALQKLEGNEGAKKLFSLYKEQLAIVPFPLGSIDIDTAENYKSLLKNAVHNQSMD